MNQIMNFCVVDFLTYIYIYININHFNVFLTCAYFYGHEEMNVHSLYKSIDQIHCMPLYSSTVLYIFSKIKHYMYITLAFLYLWCLYISILYLTHFWKVFFFNSGHNTEVSSFFYQHIVTGASCFDKVKKHLKCVSLTILCL